MTFYYDKKRHLVCLPYTVENLHKMADELKISRDCFHQNHYDIPIDALEEVSKKCVYLNERQMITIISSKSILRESDIRSPL